MKIIKQTIACIILISLVIQSPLNAQTSSTSDTTKIIILSTNDMHARIDNFSKLSYLADSLRLKYANVFLVSAGDNFTGNPVVDQYPEKGYPMIDLMNKLHYDVSALGNHEFDLGQENLNKRMAQASFPFISCNVDASGATLKQPKPYIILQTDNGIKLAILSAIQLGENGLPDSHPDNLKGLRFEESIAKAITYKNLRQQCNIFIALTHLGIEKDTILARQMSELDMIIGGHSHTLMEKPLFVNGVMITQTGSGLKYTGKIIVLVYKSKVVGRSYELIDLGKISGKDNVVQKIIDAYNDNPVLNQVIAIAKETITGEDALGSLMTDAITDRLGLDIAFQNNGGIRSPELISGNILLKDIYKLDPFGNKVIKFRMTVTEIKSLIALSYNRGKALDLQVSGITYSVIVDSAKLLKEVRLLDRDGKALNPAKEYNVGISSYIASTYHFVHRDAGESLFTTTAQTLIDFLKAKKVVDYTGVKRAFVEVGK